MKKYLTLIFILLLVGCTQNDNWSSQEQENEDHYLSNYENEKIKIEYSCQGCELIDGSLLSSLIAEQNEDLIKLLNNPLTYNPKSLTGQCELIQNAVHMDSGEKLNDLYKLSLLIKYHAKTDMGVKREGFFENIYFIYDNQVNDTISGKIKLDSIKFLSQEKEYVNRSYEVLDPTYENSLKITPVLKESNSLLLQFENECIKTKSKIIFKFRDESDFVVNTDDYSSCTDIIRIELTSRLKKELGEKPLAEIAVIPEYGLDIIVSHTPDNQKDYFIQLINLIN